MNRRNIVVFFLSLTMLIVSILVIYLLWNIKESKKAECVYQDVTGEILKYPSNNDSDVIVKHGKEYYDQEEEPKDITIYEYNNYIITFIDKSDMSTLTIRNSNNEVIYSNKKVRLNISGIICNNGNYSDTRSYGVNPIISNGKLYFVSLSDDCYIFRVNEKKPYFEYNYIDLNDSNINQYSAVKIQEMKLKIDEYYGCEY